ncbi:MAG: HEPN domain-containing protein [Clostridia bacterium]
MLEEKKEYINEWIKKANKDVYAADIMNEAGNAEEIVCFHCEQAIEKLLKAYMIYKNEEILKTHNLNKLFLICSKYNDFFSTYIHTNITEYAVEIRYPDSRDIPSTDEVKETMKTMYIIINKINELIKFN